VFARDVIIHAADMNIWNDAVWVNHKEKLFFVPIWRNGNTTFLNECAGPFGFTLEKNLNLASYIGFTFLRDPAKRIAGQIWRACINNNFSIEHVLTNLADNNSVDIHMFTQQSFLENYSIKYYVDLDELAYVGHGTIDSIIDIMRIPKLVKDSENDKTFALEIEGYLKDNTAALGIIDSFYQPDKFLYDYAFPTVGIFGLGKIGTVLRDLLVEFGISVVGYDPKVSDSDNIERVANAKVIWVCVDTPTLSWGDDLSDMPSDYNTTNLRTVLANIKTRRPVIVGCTVSPGTTNDLDYDGPLYYMPFLISQGNVRDGLLHPDCWFVGATGNSEVVLNLIEQFSNSPVHVGTYEEVELAKVLYNSWIIQKINFANWAGDLSRAVGNANSQKIMGWLSNSDKLITSSAYMKPGWGDGGPCHPRDNLMLSWLNTKHKLGYDPAFNQHQSRLAQAKLLAKRAQATGLPVCILGRSYKLGIDDNTGSYSVLLSKLLTDVCFEDADTSDQPYCYILAHNNFYEHVPLIGSVIINPWEE
jgi:UDPglucose 6-dehydrogenase|tara:strand:- start:4558 stop:6147 length:1590 start_codon:yes stop_codon:yes gene_type:complete